MAGRKVGFNHHEETRAKIQTSQLVNAVQRHALGESEMSATRLKAAEILLRKTLPDMSQITHLGDEVNPVRHVFSWASDPKPEK